MPLAGEPSPVPIWGYVDCRNRATPPALTRPGGPTLEYDQDDDGLDHLHNNLSVATGLVFPGLPQPPDTTGRGSLVGRRHTSFTVAKPGTFLYQAALLPKSQYQVAMGLYGAMNVLPTGGGKAYADAVPATQDSTFDQSRRPGAQRDRPGAEQPREPGRVQHAQLRAALWPDQRCSSSEHSTHRGSSRRQGAAPVCERRTQAALDGSPRRAPERGRLRRQPTQVPAQDRCRDIRAWSDGRRHRHASRHLERQVRHL